MRICISGYPGSGKSYAVQQVIKNAGRGRILEVVRGARYSEEYMEGKPLLTFYSSLNLYVLGPYPSGRNIVGMDIYLSDADQVIRDVLAAVPRDVNVLMEGYFFSFSPRKWANLAHWDGEEWVFCYLDTPFTMCLDNLAERSGSERTITVGMKNRWRSIQRNRDRLGKMGFVVRSLGKEPWTQILEMISSGVSTS